MSRSQTSLDGIVVHVRNLGDAHRVVELLTSELGRVSLVARGSRASKRRFAGALDLFISLRAQVNTRPNLWTLEQADILKTRVGIRTSLRVFERAVLLLECGRALSAERQEATLLYDALSNGLDALDAGDFDQAATAYLSLLTAAGIAPDLRLCARCGAKHQLVALDATGGGVVCGTCASRAGLKRFDDLSEIICHPAELDSARADALEDFALQWVEMHTGRRLRSVGALQAIRGWP